MNFRRTHLAIAAVSAIAARLAFAGTASATFRTEYKSIPSTGWTYRIDAGDNTVADSGTVMIGGLLEGLLRLPPLASMPLIDRREAAVRQSGTHLTAKTISGTPRVRTSVKPSGADTTLFACLLDVDALGLSGLVTHKPYTLRGVTPNVTQTVEFDLEPAVRRVGFGHRLALVIDTVDPRYTSESAKGTTVTFGSSSTGAALLRVPTL